MSSHFSNKRLLVDLGSSTVKVYKFEGQLEPLFSKSLHFKEGFDPASGISADKKIELFAMLSKARKDYPDYPIKVYATSIFRKMSEEAKKRFKDELFLKTGAYFNIVDHDLENFYLQTSLVGKVTLEEPVLLINIGGGSTELVVVRSGEVIETHNVDLGVGSLLSSYTKLNEPYSKHSLKAVIEDLEKQLPTLDTKLTVAFYTGGELTYMRRAGYKLAKNVLFDDIDHPVIIAFKDFAKRNEEVFTKVSLEELESLMPENPKWMHGARPCGALAQAICKKYGVETIVPSDSNLIHGIVRREFRHAVLSGSFRKHLDYILDVRNMLIGKGTQVLSPRFTEPKNPGEEFVVFSGEEGMSPLELERHHLDSIDSADVLVVCAKDGYVGASALIEIGYANSLGKRIIFTEQPEEFMLNTLPAEIGL